MKQEVTAFINRHHLLEKNATVLVGVSGGPDSMALLHLLHSMREEWNLKLIAVMVDHQLRGEESQADLDYVRDICAKWDIVFVGTSIDVPAYKRQHQMGTQLAAREVRYQFFAEQMEYFQADYLALGHHGDDQVETMLMSFVRTADSSGFSGIPSKRRFASGAIIRPLLSVTKTITEAYCEKYGIIPRIDPSNHETVYTRNYFRKHVIPLLKEKNQKIHTTVQYLSESLQSDEDFLQTEANKVLEDIVDLDIENKTASLKINQYKSHPLALQRRVFHLILKYLYDELPKDLSYVHEAHLFTLIGSEKSNARMDFPSQLKVEKSYGNLSFYFLHQHPLHSPFHEVLSIPGELELPDGSSIKASLTDVAYREEKHIYCCDVEQVALPLHIRTRKPGDRMRWKGLNGSKKLKDIFIDEKIPLRERNKWPIMVDNNNEILWLIGIKKGQPATQGKPTEYIQIEYKEAIM
ncbi:tRNA(Ile)-lysidine synthase [Virgibacillus halotolerans]|uniref:tRNA lysidine(34) synthetase TilS n=1 Tax=Virgibacillus halotolerans TaxID=1071053 RepID=UPI001961BE66|nr:tRNA lysidine(34) synthetase TilS [Virgibacillus halotolerans]MBM7601282.1 tRNA(Ile)-lysidine synthase [Virgibacillus halotolerans]